MAFEADGKSVTWLDTVDGFCRALESAAPSAAILDRVIGATDSLDVLGDLRARGIGVPVIVISSLSSVDERIRGLRNGGDDYLTKPFVMAELVARVAALMRRSAATDRSTVVAGPLRLDLVSRRVTCGDREVDLHSRELALLAFLMRHAGQLVTRSMLLEEVWNYRSSMHTNVIDVHIGHLRRKLEADGGPQLIRTVRGVGFVLDVGGAIRG